MINRRGRRWSVVFGLGYLLLLVPAVWSEATSPHPDLPILGGVAVFVFLDVWFWVRGGFGERQVESLVALAALCAIATAATLANGNWIWLFIYCAVSASALGGDWRRSVTGSRAGNDRITSRSSTSRSAGRALSVLCVRWLAFANQASSCN